MAKPKLKAVENTVKKEVKITNEQRLENLIKQQKEAEAVYLKLDGAISILREITQEK